MKDEWCDCENCENRKRCFAEHKDPDEAEAALNEMGCCEICIEDQMQE